MTYDNGLYWEPTRGRMAHLLHEGALAGEGQGGRVLDVGPYAKHTHLIWLCLQAAHWFKADVPAGFSCALQAAE